MLKREDNLSPKSYKSYKSNKSTKSILTDKSSGFTDFIKEFEICFPLLCAKYGLIRDVHVKKEYREEEYYKHLQVSEAGKRKRTLVGVLTPQSATSKHSLTSKITDLKDVTTTGTDTNEPPLDIDAIILAAIYDSYNRLVEIFLYKVEVPRELIKILAFIARYYIDFKRLKIQLCKTISSGTIYEISKLITVSSISEVDLDGCYCRKGNYGILFDSGKIINMSLSKCCINDDVCEIIASKIGIKGPAEKSLYSLNLSSNHITDVGAISLAKALRSNRKLRYLNLAGNYITDTGAGCILDALKEFSLTPEENLAKSKRYMDYERKRMIYYWRFLHDIESRNDDPTKNMKLNGKRKSTGLHKNKIITAKPAKKDQLGRRDSQKGVSENPNRSRDLLQRSTRSPSHRALMTYDDMRNRAQILAGEMMGPFRDPFQSTAITIRQGKCYSKGNMSVCYLNLGYNHLGYQSVVKLLDVLKYQNETKTTGQIGLVRVMIKGNNMPESCLEYMNIDELLTKSMKASGGRAFTDFNARRKSRASSVLPYKFPKK